MIKRIFFLTSLLFFASSFADNMTEQEFDDLVIEISDNLNAASQDMFYMNSTFEDADARMFYYYNQYHGYTGNGTSYSDGYKDGLTVAADNMYGVWNNYKTLFRRDQASINLQLSEAQSQLNQLRFVNQSTNNVDLTEVVQLLRDLKDRVTTIRDSITVLQGKLTTFLDYANDVDQEFRKYFKLAYDRLKVPDSDLSSQLNMMWGELLYNISNIVSDVSHYTVSDSLENITPDGTDVRLSNEGLISAANLAVNERSYLTLVDINNKLDNVGTNSTDLTWITNYLNSVQQPFFQLVNDYTKRINLVGINDWLPSSHTAITNFFQTLRTPYVLSKWNTAKNDYRKIPNGTNILWRIENALYGLYGAWDEKVELADGQDEDTLNNNLDEENITRQLDYSTNAIPEFVSNVAGLSNGWNRISAKFKSVIDSFLFDSGSDSGYYEMVRLTPEYELGGIEVPYFHFTLDQSIGNAIRLFFTAFWYIIFAALFFKLFMMLFYLLGRFIAHTVLVVSTLLS